MLTKKDLLKLPMRSRTLSKLPHNTNAVLNEKGLLSHAGKLRYINDDYCEISRRGETDLWNIVSVSMLVIMFTWFLSMA